VRRADGSYGVVADVAHTYEPQVMYNLTVDTAHTFFVGDGAWLVHNVCGYGDSKKLARNMRLSGNPQPGGHQPHHLIPTELDHWHPFIARARNAGWDVNDAYNGLWLPDEARHPGLSLRTGLPGHSTYHGNYNRRVQRALDALELRAIVQGWSDSQSLDRLLQAATGFELYIRKMGGGTNVR
jgi:hypothetical protein